MHDLVPQGNTTVGVAWKASVSVVMGIVGLIMDAIAWHAWSLTSRVGASQKVIWSTKMEE
jgi:hypothetical protein